MIEVVFIAEMSQADFFSKFNKGPSLPVNSDLKSLVDFTIDFALFIVCNPFTFLYYQGW